MRTQTRSRSVSVDLAFPLNIAIKTVAIFAGSHVVRYPLSLWESFLLALLVFLFGLTFTWKLSRSSETTMRWF